MPNFVELSVAADRLTTAQRISIAGVSGAGKSTLSQHIAKRRDLPYVSLDRDMRWLPGWQVRDRTEQRRLHDDFTANERWVIDGTSIGLMDTRLPRSELVIWLRPGRWSALAGIARRVIRNHGQVRPDMADGCPEQPPDGEFLRWIWTFEQKQAPRLLDALNRFAPDVPVCVLRTRGEAQRLLALADMGG